MVYLLKMVDLSMAMLVITRWYFLLTMSQLLHSKSVGQITAFAAPLVLYVRFCWWIPQFLLEKIIPSLILGHLIFSWNQLKFVGSFRNFVVWISFENAVSSPLLGELRTGHRPRCSKTLAPLVREEEMWIRRFSRGRGEATLTIWPTWRCLW